MNGDPDHIVCTVVGVDTGQHIVPPTTCPPSAVSKELARDNLGKRARYKRELRALRRYAWTRRVCIALSISLLLAAVCMAFGWL